ncbi:hypothetical protein TEA_003094 [Camellia sinensis var. sinensis]|uniref:Protein kinase domain-containing protein n=1 Tax=Camellia sinensis var. sinensis TaxID=542762 RepID=A0A4S4EY72_CAMSN|nr:hypothetical protein TEA_003094 [Camellia sinensis var. sinensis]
MVQFVISSTLFFLGTFHATHLLLLFLTFTFPNSSPSATLTDSTDKLALLNFKSHIIEDPEGVLSSWNTSLHFCDWIGVTCSLKHQRITRLDLQAHQLTGTISPAIGNLSILRSLDLGDNSFHGEIPVELSHLSRLQNLNLSFNFLTGTIPTNLSRCSDLANLLLDHNYLVGHIPPQLGSLSNLLQSGGRITRLHVPNAESNDARIVGKQTVGIFSSLDLQSFVARAHIFILQQVHCSSPSATLTDSTDKLALLNFKSHIIEDPEGVLSSWNTSLHFCDWIGVTCSLKHQRITRLDLQAHQLTGTISPAIGNLSFLRSLDHGDNAFHGEIPLELSHLSRLQNLNLSFNFLTGTIPANLSRCSDLANLLLDHNYLVGHIPPQLGSLSNLVMLYLKNNNLTGTVPGTIGNLTSLQELYLSYNYNLEGELPDSMSQMRSLTMLGLSVNRLSGFFPHSLYNLPSLELISLSFNKFSGNLRPNIGVVFPNLRNLYLANNFFTGPIPDLLSNASQISRIDIPYNNFTGNVPMSFGNLQSLWWFNVLDNDLGSGRPDDLSFITSLTNCSQIEFLDIADNRFGGVLPSYRQSVNPIDEVTCLWKQNSWNYTCSYCQPLQLGHTQYGGKLSYRVGGKGVAGIGDGDCFCEWQMAIGNGFSFLFFKEVRNLTNLAALDVSKKQIVWRDSKQFGKLFCFGATFYAGEFGEVPAQGVFKDVSGVEVSSNMKLCGGIRELNLHLCPVQSTKKPKKHIAFKLILVLIIVASWLFFCAKKLKSKPQSTSSSVGHEHPKISYEELLNATNRFSSSNLIGSAIDVASALDYLHNHYETPVAHCDLKPSNVFLDNDFTTHVSNFGLAQLLCKFSKEARNHRVCCSRVWHGWKGLNCRRCLQLRNSLVGAFHWKKTHR